MEKIYFIILFSCMIISGYSQVGINTTYPSPASVLDVRSSNDGTNYGGFLPPRVNMMEREDIPVTAADDGMMVFLQEGDTRCVQIWNGVDMQWEDVFCMPINSVPVANSVTFSGTLLVDETLTASFLYTDSESDPAGAHVYKWYAADDGSGAGTTVVQNSTSNSYTVTSSDLTKYIAVEVTPVAISGNSPGIPVFSSYRGPVIDGTLEELASWEFFGNSGDEATVNATVIATNIQDAVVSRGTGISPSINGDRFNANNFTQPDITGAVANDDYFQFTITPTTGKQITITQVSFNYQRSSTGPPSATLRSSVDGFTADIATITGLTETTDPRTIDVSGAAIVNQATTVTFRLYMYGNTNSAGSGGFEGTGSDLVITGVVN